MNWKNLKNNKCPSCSEPLKDIGAYYACTRTGCVFSINKHKFDEVVNSLYRNGQTKYYTQQDYSEELNNFGHKLITEDFIN